MPPFLALVLAGVLWGTGGIIGSLLADASGASSVAIAAFRLSLGGTVLVAVELARRSRTTHALNRILLTGIVAAVFQGCYFAAVASGDVASATLVTIGSAPVLVTVVDAIRVRAFPPAVVLLRLTLGVGGLAMLVGGTPSGVVSMLFALTSGAAFAAFTMLGRRPLPPGVGQSAVTAWGFVVGGALLFIVAAVGPGAALELSGESVSLLVLFALVPTALAYTLFFRGLRGATAATATLVALLEPLTATVLAVLILNEPLTVTMVFGAVLLLLSIVLLLGRPTAAPATAAP
ncbi:EamA family transporter [Actinomycetes bacterium M1A6_2h]